MFDLFRRRDRNVRILLTVLLGFVALSMVAYLIPGGPGTPGMTSNDTVIAEVGDEQITMMEVQRTLQGALRGKQFPPEMLQNYVPTLVDQMIAERAVAYQAGRMGLRLPRRSWATRCGRCLATCCRAVLTKIATRLF